MKLTTACEKTNSSKVQEELYGKRISGIFGYSHFVGGFSGGQAEYVRVPLADNNLLKLPSSVPDEKGLSYLVVGMDNMADLVLRQGYISLTSFPPRTTP